MTDTIRQTVKREADRAEFKLEDPALTALVEFVGILSHWAKRLRLVGTPDATLLVQRHLCDAFWVTRELQREGARRCLDVGAGAGLPGIPVAILNPTVELTLVEPKQRRCAFLQTAASRIELNITIASARIEQLSLEPVDMAWSRATWSPARWLQIALPLLRPKGHVLVMLGSADPPSQPAGAVLTRTISYTLTDRTPRSLVTYQRLNGGCCPSR